MNNPNRLFTLLLIISLTACNFPGAQPSPTASAISGPTNTPGAPPATETAAPTETATPEGGSGLEAIVIASPGSNSIVTSAVTVLGESRPTFEQTLVIAIYGEDGIQLAQQPTTILADAGSPGLYTADLAFSVDHEQAGRISVFETSAMDGGIQHLSSVEVTLSPTGPANIVPATIDTESILIQSPAPLAEISGGTITISGFSAYYFESQLGMVLCGGGDGGGAADELCGDAHNVLGSGTAMINSPDVGQPGPFSGTLTWSVLGPVNGRIVVFARSPRDGGLVHVASIPVIINP
jgi:hypothetical protein